MSDTLKGILAMIAACFVWGLSPIYYKVIAHVPPLEVLSHRTIWSFVIFALVLLGQGRFRQILTLLSERRNFALIAFSALMISLNWFGFIFAIQLGRTVEASLGYYLFPLTASLLGLIFFREKLAALQWFAMAMTVAAVLILSLGLKAPPLIAIYLATSFGLYGVVKKALNAGPIVSVTAEVFVLLPFALAWIVAVQFFDVIGIAGRSGGFFGADLVDSLFLISAGIITATPLILFSYATKRLGLATIGLLQLLNPSLQFTVAVLALGEVITFWHALAFPLIWAALALYSFVAMRRDRLLASASRSSTV